MRIDFLSAADQTALTKTYTNENGTWTTSAYPMVRDFRSRSVEIADLDDLLLNLLAHSATHCALKGQLTKPLENESRAGHTLPDQPTEWLLLDYDADSGFESVDEMLAALDPGLADVSYIWQHSSSAGLREDSRLRGHAFVLLEQPQRPGVLKEWLKACNLRVPALRNLITLSASGFSVRWPLDITTCQSDKLIYITPPEIVGGEDLLKDKRFELIRKDKERATLDLVVNPGANQAKLDTLIAELRKDAGLRKLKPRYSKSGQYELLDNPDHAAITGVRHQRGFTYLNLNHGDSWAYYYPDDNPEILYNFKGEPPVRLQAICPDHYAAVMQNVEPGKVRIRPLVFRDIETDVYYNGVYTEAPEEGLVLHQVGSLQKIEHFLAQYGEPPPDPVQDWTVRFDPTSLKLLDWDKRWANLFSPTPYLRRAQSATPVSAVPAVINRVLRSITVDDETYHYFVNWLAYIFQTREKAGTAWIFHGVPGTGKGVFFEHVLQKLFGERYAHMYTTQSIEEMFNSNLEQEIITWLDEFRLDDGVQATKLMNKVKNLVTENNMMIRGMRRNAVQRRVYNNIIIATNHEDSTPLEVRDRRFNVAPAQDTPLTLTPEEVDQIADELDLFAAFLWNYEYDYKKVRTPMKNRARELTIAASETSVNRFFRALREGDFDYFLDYAVDSEAGAAPDLRKIQFVKVVRDWANQVGSIAHLSRDSLMHAYNYLQGAQMSATKFSRMCKIHNIEIKPGRMNDRVIRGFSVLLKTQDPAEVAAFKSESTGPKLTAVNE